MSRLNRRNFLQVSTGAMAALAYGAQSGTAAAAMELPKAAAVRTLGNTGLSASYLGIGTGIKGSAPNITKLKLELTGNEFIGLLEHAYRQGITFFDLADRYGSHDYMREALKRSVPREKVMLLSKIWSREPGQVQKDLDRMRKELNVDCIDVVLMHCLRGGEDDWPKTLRATMDVLSEAKAKGHIKAHGVSCHTLQSLDRVAETGWCEVVMARINPLGSRMDGPVDKVVPILRRIHAAGKGIVGMKIFGEGDPALLAKMDESIKFAGELGVLNAMTIGFMSTQELDDTMSRINRIASA
jgi:1-deoxyxylulose-5-phosphate synthase